VEGLLDELDGEEAGAGRRTAIVKWIWEPSPEFAAATNVRRFMDRLGIGRSGTTTLVEFLRYSTDHLEEFWAQMVEETGIEWAVPYRQVLDVSRGVEWARWFTGGKVNIAANCLDRHRGVTRPAIIAEREDGAVREIGFAELLADTNRLANALRQMGIERGDRVALCMPMEPEVVTILYACFKLGAVAVPIFAGFGAGAIAARLEDSGAKVVFTAEWLTRRGKQLPLRSKVEEARGNARVILYGDLPATSPEFATEALNSETPALLLYTSGTTGKPKGTVHTHAGTLAQVTKEIWLAFDHQPEDRFFWLSDIGWMMGPWTILGNHHFGGTVFLYDGAPDYPAPDRLWRMIERHGLTTFGVSPTAIRMLMRSDSARDFPMDSLRLLGSTGEPWDETSYKWFFEHVGKRRCPIINISGGTEIIGCFLQPMPIQPLKPCSLGGPAPGMAAEVRDGCLVCTKPAPSMTRGLWNDFERYIETYWSQYPGVWWHGDFASVDEDGCWFLHGRADESMNVAGRKVGPAEIEQAVLEHPSVREAAVIGVPDELKGESPVAFVVLKEGYEFTPALASEIIRRVGESLSPVFRPAEVRAVPALPKTQSGKIVRRLIRREYLGEEPGDISTVQNPEALDAFRRE
jgi:acetyl-CoA synthetase